jgi:hypothetical protein
VNAAHRGAGGSSLTLHHKVRTDAGELELLGHDAEAGTLVEGPGGATCVAPHPQGAGGDGALKESVEHRRASSFAARSGGRRHAAHAPGTRLTVGSYQSDGDQRTVREETDRKRIRGLVCRKALDRFVAPQNRLAKRSSFGKRDLPYYRV